MMMNSEVPMPKAETASASRGFRIGSSLLSSIWRLLQRWMMRFLSAVVSEWHLHENIRACIERCGPALWRQMSKADGLIEVDRVLQPGVTSQEQRPGPDVFRLRHCILQQTAADPQATQ